MTAEMVIAGAAGRAVRIDHDGPHGRAWVIELNTPVIADEPAPFLASQFVVAAARLTLVDGGDPRGATYRLSLAPLAKPWTGGRSIALYGKAMTWVDFVPDDAVMATHVARAVAGSIAAGHFSPAAMEIRAVLTAVVRAVTFALFQQRAELVG